MARPYRMAWVSALGGLAVAGCDTNAVGVEECRTIERARCAAAQHCDLRLDSKDSEAECERFARDNCLHGLLTPAPPKASQLDRCVRAIQAVGSCARKEGASSLASDCSALAGSVLPTDATVCEIVQDPDEASECAFLAETPVTETPKDAGQD